MDKRTSWLVFVLLIIGSIFIFISNNMKQTLSPKRNTKQSNTETSFGQEQRQGQNTNNEFPKKRFDVFKPTLDNREKQEEQENEPSAPEQFDIKTKGIRLNPLLG